MRRVLIIQTTTHDPSVSTSWAMGWEAAKWFKKVSPEGNLALSEFTRSLMGAA